MFFHCKHSRELCTPVNDWIIELSMEDNNLSNTNRLFVNCSG